MKMVPLGDLMVARTQTLNPSKYADEEFELYSIPSFDQGTPEIAQGRVIGSTKQTVEPRDVLVSKIVPHIRRATVIPPASGRKQLASNEWIVFRHDSFDPRYLVHFLTSDLFHRQFLNTVAGVGGSLLRARPQYVRSILAPIPPLDEQRRIAAILDKADAIRQNRHQAIAHVDTLNQSVFHEMFGSPLTNNKGFRTAPIRHASRVVTGSSPSRKDPSNFGSSVEWIKTDNLSGEIATVASEYLSEAAKEKARLAPAGSILVCCIAGSRNSIGKASMTDRQVSFNQQINAILPADEIDPVFLLWQLKSAPELVRRKSTDGMKGLVNKTQFEAIEILVPHISKQKTFRNIAETISNHKRAYIGLEHKSSTLFESLQSRAFQGKL